MFSGVIPARRSASLSRLGREGLKTSSPSLAVRLTSVPAPKPTSSAKPRGILTPRLFPHFCTLVCMPEWRLYTDYTTGQLGSQCPISLTAWIERAQPRSIRCWTSPAPLGSWGCRALNLREINPPAFQVPFTIGLDDR